MAKKYDADGEKEWLEFKQKFYKIMWNLFVFWRVPIILVWMAFILGLLIGSYM